MNKVRIASLLLSAVMCCSGFVSCDSKKNESSSETPISSETVKNNDNYIQNGMNALFEQEEEGAFDSDSCAARVLETLESSEKSDEPLTFGSIGEAVSPKEDDLDADLGDYRESENGIKLYFNEDEFPKELVQTLEQYFISLENADYSLYTRCVYPDYLEKMEAFLKKDYSYDMKTSFSNQCANLASIMNGSFRVSRIKIEPAEQYNAETPNLDMYFQNLEGLFGLEQGKYYEETKNNSDNIYDAQFYVMAQGKDEETESLLVSGYEIVFVEKDGRYYIFG